VEPDVLEVVDALDVLEAADALEAAEAAAEQLARCDLSSLGHPESIARLERLGARTSAIITGAVAAFDATEGYAPSGARTTGAYLKAECHLPGPEAKRQVRRGRHARHLPLFAAAWAAGEITADYLDLVAQVRRPATEEALARDEPMLVEQAKVLPHDDFARALAYWVQHADPDGAEEDDMERRARRDVYLVSSIAGTYLGKMTLDAISGAIVAGELGRLERELFEADWAEAKEALGRDPRLDELGRTSAQRRADALVEMATRSASAPADGRRPAPLFSVLVDYQTLSGRMCQLAQGARTVLTPGSLLPWLDEAFVERTVFAPGKRAECSVTARFFTGGTRRAIELRDQVCQHPYCDRPVEQCQADHIVEYSKGGLTTQENGRLLCAFHNRLRNQRPPPPALE
jgi:Domain of unknown function (DUF222)/HNH endonuclease